MRLSCQILVRQMPHTSNIKAFLSTAAASESPLIQAYCGLVAIELAIKGAIRCSDHNIPDAMKRLGRQARAPALNSSQKAALNALAVQLTNDLSGIKCLDKDGVKSISVPGDNYPYMRYTRFEGDGWGSGETPVEKLRALASCVNRVRFQLKRFFGLPL